MYKTIHPLLKLIVLLVITLISTSNLTADDTEDGLKQFAEDNIFVPERNTPFRPKVIAMNPSVLFFEEGWGFTVNIEQAQDIVDQAYLYVEQYLNKDVSDSRESQNNRLILATIQQERSLSSAQVFARQNSTQRYLYINIFPTRSISNQHQLRSQLWRAQRNSSPAFWRIRYDLDKQQFFGFSYDYLT